MLQKEDIRINVFWQEIVMNQSGLNLAAKHREYNELVQCFILVGK